MLHCIIMTRYNKKQSYYHGFVCLFVLFICSVLAWTMAFTIHYVMHEKKTWNVFIRFYICYLSSFFLSDSVKTLGCSIDRPFFQIEFYFKNQLTSYVYYWHEVNNHK